MPEELTTTPSFVDTVRPDEDDVEVVIEPEVLEEGAKEKYYEAVGRRKEAIARVRLMTRKANDPDKGEALVTVNGKGLAIYFNDANLQEAVLAPLKRLKSLARFKVSALVSGGGIAGQADAVRHGISRALELFDANFRKKLKKAGFLTRDPRRVQRKMPGKKKARKSGRWAKR